MDVPPNPIESQAPALPRREAGRAPFANGEIRAAERGSAILITLTMIVLITVVVLVFVVQTKLERQLSALNWDDQQAKNVAQMGFDSALKLIRETLQPYDDPFGSTNPPTTFWALSPGRIDRFNFTPNASNRPTRTQTVALHTGYPLVNSNDAADLNAPDSLGNRPIWSEERKMEVDWVSVGRDPSTAISAANPMVGRFAFWVDDEGSKINVNTADGSDNYTLSGYGQGTPTSVSLSVFRDVDAGDTNAPDRETVRLVAAEARRQPFATISEIATRATLTNAAGRKFPATNAFNLTTYSRSPDFNIWNEPRFQLIPSNVDWLGQLAGSANFIPINRTLQYLPNGGFYASGGGNAQSALRSLYPTPRQLTNAWTNVYPLMPNYPRQDGGLQLVTSTQKRDAAGGNFSVNQASRFAAMLQMARYLVGTNAFGQSIRWPFTDATYLSKYNLRQIDSIALQIFEMPRNAAFRTYHPGYGWEYLNIDAMINPSILPYGLLGTNPVGSAIGRYPRLTRVLARVSVYPRAEAFPKLNAATFYPGIQTNAVGNPIPGTGYDDGVNFRMNLAFSQYIPRHLYDSDNLVDGRAIELGRWDFGWASPFGWSWQGGMNEMDGAIDAGSALNPSSRWMDTLLYAEADYGSGFIPGNSSGIDFRANPGCWGDPDPRRTEMRREEYKSLTGNYAQWPVTNSGFMHWGSGYADPYWFDPNRYSFKASPMLRFVPFGVNPRFVGPSAGLSQNFSHRFYGNGVDSPGGALDKNFRTRNLLPPGSDPIRALRLRGGLTLQTREQGRAALTPVDAILGPLNGNWSSRVTTNSPTVLTNLTKAVVPLFTTNGLEVERGQTKYIVAKLRDPMVGQLPGDWLVTNYSGLPGTNQTAFAAAFTTWPDNEYSGNATQFNYAVEPEWVDMAAESGAVLIQAEGSPNTVWRPYMAAGVQRIRVDSAFTDGAFVNLARQKSFPSIGHLQYVRTGAMPDNENAQLGDADYAGMPFRCLNFGPANTQGGIPDWAMLDLFTVPNAIWTLPSSRFAYPAISAGQTNRPELIQLTYGGASSGKINLNGAALWPWVENDANFVRPMPLAAQFNGLRYNQDGTVYRISNPGWKVRAQTSTNSWRVLSAPAARTLAEAIAAYLRVNGPLAMPGQMCDIPAVNAYGAEIPTRKTINGVDTDLLPPNTGFYARGLASPDNFNRTRNDIVSQSMGNFTTQGNVFAVWVVGESIRKSSRSDPTLFEPEKGDRVVGQSRMRFLVERKLDPGVDGVYGNSAPGGAGLDGTVGSPDDLVNATYHPLHPKFIYQVINLQEIL